MSDAPLSPRLTKARTWALVVGLVGIGLAGGAALIGGVSGTGGLLDRGQFFRSYLIAYLVLLAPVVGSLALLMVHHLTGGNWGLVLRPVLEAAARLTPVAAVLFVPILFGLADIYPWARWTPEQIDGSTMLQHKRTYLNPVAFMVRSVIYLGVWVLLSVALTGRSDDERWQRRRAAFSGPGLVLFVLTVTFAAVDWVMSLEPMWWSSIFGLLFASGQVLAAMAFSVLCLVLVVRGAKGDVPKAPLQDLGSLMLAMVMVWAYMAFSQFLLIWSGNLPEEIPWYQKRLTGGWQVLGVLLILAQFVLPFFLLLSRDLKRDARALAVVAGVVLLMRVVDLYWMVAPAFFPYRGFRLHWMDVAALAGVAGLGVAAFLYLLGSRPLVLHVPEEESHHE